MFWLFMNGFLHIAFAIGLYVLLFRHHFRYSMKHVYSACIVVTLIGMSIPIFLNEINPQVEEWVTTFSVCYMILLFILCTTFTRFSPYRILLVFFIIANYMDVITLYKDSIGPFIVDVLPEMEYYATTVVTRFIVILITYPIMIWFSLKMLRPIIDRPTSQPYFRYLWLIPACFFIMYRLCINPQEHEVFFIYHDIPLIITLIWSFGTFMITYSILKMLLDMMDRMGLEKQLEVQALNNRMQQKQYEQMMHKMEETRTIRHDLRHHVLALKSYYDTQAYEDMNHYLQTMLQNIDSDTPIMYCDNVMLSGILNYYIHIAKEAHIDCDIQVSVPRKLHICDEDLCVVVGNAIENAIEACTRQTQEKRFLKVKAQVFGEDAFTMRVVNSFEGSIRKSKMGHYLSSKRNEEGIGLSSIKQICTKYAGVCKIEQDEHVFTLSILLNQNVRIQDDFES